MQTYRRFVSYVYQYENGKKAGNRGFIKVEARGNTCSMQISLKGVCRDGNGTCKVYGFKREEGLLKGSLLAECPVKMGIVQEQLVSLRNEMGDARYSLHDLSGVIFRGDDETMYGTQWDDEPMKMENFQPDERNIRRRAAVEGPGVIEDQGAEEQQRQPEPETPAMADTRMGERLQETGAEPQTLEAGNPEEIGGEFPRAESLQEEIPPTEMGQEEIPRTEPLQAEMQRAEIPQEEIEQEEIPRVEMEQEEIEQAESLQPEIEQTEIRQEEIEQAESQQPEIEQTEIVQEEIEQAESLQPEIQQTAVLQEEIVQGEVQQEEIQQPEIQRTAAGIKAQGEIRAQEKDGVGTVIQDSVGERGIREERRMPPKGMEGPVSDGQGSGGRSAELPGGSGSGRILSLQEESPAAERPEQRGLAEMSGPQEGWPAPGPAERRQEMEERGSAGGTGQWELPEGEGLPEVLDTTVPIPDTEGRLPQDGRGSGLDESAYMERGQMESDHIEDHILEGAVMEERAEEDMAAGEVSQRERYIGAEMEAEDVEGTAAQREDRFCPFTDGVLEDCRKISIEDLRFLDPRDQGMRNNRFVQHGYQMFGHLLLAKVARNSQYILGVPGMYQKQEKFMADMFGFHNFKCARRKSNRQACFGYWYRLIYPPKLGRRNEKADRS